MSVAVTMTQQAQAPQRFVEQPTTYSSDSIGPDPELKKLLPIFFNSLDLENDISDNSAADIFAKLFVDNTKGAVRKSVGSQKIVPIASDEMAGISTYYSRSHPGIDYRAKIGTTIRAILPGTVNEVGYERGGYGRYVILVHHVDGQTLFSLYAHMRSTNVIEGDLIEAGQKVGEVGLTGHTTGPHLHFELHNNLSAMDPRRFFSGDTLAMVVK